MTATDRLSHFAKRMKTSFPAMPQTQIADYLQGTENQTIAESEPEPATPPVGATMPIGAVDIEDPAHAPHHPSDEPTSLISAVIAHRRRHGLTQEQLAAELGIS
ncbi:helix-turn-helix domain-containing protein, partial [Halorhodospira halochloris]|uniref:helix-turn-helix domain-containing protein n=1 Tax=Halorhodospira halochloris TaxID=1052 RepID=UPI001EE7FAFD